MGEDGTIACDWGRWNVDGSIFTCRDVELKPGRRTSKTTSGPADPKRDLTVPLMWVVALAVLLLLGALARNSACFARGHVEHEPLPLWLDASKGNHWWAPRCRRASRQLWCQKGYIPSSKQAQALPWSLCGICWKPLWWLQAQLSSLSHVKRKSWIGPGRTSQLPTLLLWGLCCQCHKSPWVFSPPLEFSILEASLPTEGAKLRGLGSQASCLIEVANPLLGHCHGNSPFQWCLNAGPLPCQWMMGFSKISRTHGSTSTRVKGKSWTGSASAPSLIKFRRAFAATLLDLHGLNRCSFPRQINWSLQK